MAAREMSYNSMKIRNRLASAVEDAGIADETENFNIPAFLRRKGSEGLGRRRG